MTDDLRRTLLSLAEPPLLPPDPIAHLEHRSRRRQHRRTAARIAVVTAAAVVLFAGAVRVIDNADRRDSIGVTATNPSTTATTVAATTAVPPTTTVATTVVAPAAPSTTRPPSTTIVTPTTALACRNSYDPACGPFRWDPGAVSSPLTITATAEPSNPKVGQEVIFTIEVTGRTAIVSPTATDPGDGGPMRPITGGVSCATPLTPDQYGPWDLPTPGLTKLTVQYGHTYTAPGSYVARFAYQTVWCNTTKTQIPNPYPGDGEGTIAIVVMS